MTEQQIFPAVISDDFRTQLLQLLAERILCYNGGKSSSILTEEAEKLLESILYCIRIYFDSAEMRDKDFAGITAQEAYRKGLQLVKDEVVQAKEIYKAVLKSRVVTDLIAYNVTLDGAIPGFFRTYDPEYGAHENGGLTGFPDYPLLCDDQSRGGGIRYMKAYLEELQRENEFCGRYRKNYIRSLLFVHGQKHRLDYREMLVNIPELILEKENAPRPYRV